MQAGLEVPVRLCVTDLDGCLLDASGRLPEGFFETVERCGQRGVTVCAASGRSVQGIKKVFGPASDRLALISDNGGRVFIRGEEQVCRDIPRALWAPVAALARECGGVHTVLTLTEGAVLDSFRALSPREAQELEKYYPKWSPEDLSSFTGNAVKLSLLYFGDIEREILPRFACFGERGLAVRCTAPIWIDVNRADVDKSDGVRDLQRILNVSPRETAVFGGLPERPFHGGLRRMVFCPGKRPSGGEKTLQPPHRAS